MPREPRQSPDNFLPPPMLFEGGLQLAAVHNHRIELSPHVIWVHFSGQGQPATLAAAVHRAQPLRADEVNPVARVFRQSNVQITPLHSHYLTAQPRLFYMHTYAVGDAKTLAQVHRSAMSMARSKGKTGGFGKG